MYRAAVEEGIVAGGGVAFLRAVAALDKVKVQGDELVGVAIVRKALEAPIRQIAENGGIDGSIVCDRVQNASGSEGYNALTDEYTDLIKAGIIDPTKVTRTALENAASIAGLLLTTEALVSEIPEEKKAGGGGGMPGGGGGMY